MGAGKKKMPPPWLIVASLLFSIAAHSQTPDVVSAPIAAPDPLSFEQLDLQGQSLGFILLHPQSPGVNVCGGKPGFSGPGTFKPEAYPDKYVHHAVDYCRELVIVDRDVLAGLKGVSFGQIFVSFANSAPDDQYKNWIENWNSTVGEGQPGQACDEDGEIDVACARSDTYHVLKTHSPNDFKLIAVVNRFDLAQPEARLVYQLITNGSPSQFSVIFEFDMAEFDRERIARNWHALGNGVHNSRSYGQQLQSLVSGFAKPGKLLRVRTNEGLQEGEWQFRQFDRSKKHAVGLVASDLTKAIHDKYQTMCQAIPSADCLAIFAASSHDIINNTEGFYQTPQWLRHEPYKAGIVSVQGTRLWPASPPEWFIVAFNTCNGCHHNANDGSRRHLALLPATGQAQLSTFLTQSIPLEYPVPECSNARLTGCINNRKSWNELKNRSDFLLYNALQPPRSPLEVLGEKLVDYFSGTRPAAVGRVH